MSAITSIQVEFELAKVDFLKALKDPDKYDFSQLATIEQVFEETDKIQKAQGQTGTLRNLRKIQPYLECISQYSGVLDTFVQVKPDLLTLIWGPIKLLLQISSTYVQSYDKLLEAMAQIGETLPRFQAYRTLFEDNTRVQQVLCIFYRDILDFHAVVLNFFAIKGWRVFFESLWPRYDKKISLILNNMARHRLLMDNEVTLANIEAACDTRARIYAEYDRQEAFNEHQRFELVKLSMGPRLYDSDLERISENCCTGAGDWALREKTFGKWLDQNDQSTRLLWLTGIPGAGKTFVCSSIIRQIQARNTSAVFAYLNYQYTLSKLGMLHSFIFQLLLDHSDFRSILHHEDDTNHRKLRSSADFAQNLLENLLRSIGLTYIVVDGFDEIEISSRQALLETLIQIAKACPQTRFLFSSRDESDISRALKGSVQVVQIGEKNLEDIKAYIRNTGRPWLLNLPLNSSASLEMQNILDEIPRKAQGMFLYARLVLSNLMAQGSLTDLRKEASNLPNGLDEAFIFGPQSNFFLRKTNAHRNIAAVCLSYLSFDCFQPDLQGSEISRSILAGDFVLQSYAESQWFEHVKKGAQSGLGTQSFEGFCDEIAKLLEVLSNPDFLVLSEPRKNVQHDLKPFHTDWPELYETLYHVSFFRDSQRRGQNNATHGVREIHDPLLISTSSIRIRSHFESLICSSQTHNELCYCQSLLQHYGINIHKCNKPACKFFHVGFESAEKKQRHIRAHERPFKCWATNCDFADIGFTSQSSLDKHSSYHHESIPVQVVQEIKEADANTVEAMAFDAVEMGEVNYLRSLLEQLPSPPLEELLRKAVGGSSVAIVKLLLEQGNYNIDTLLGKPFLPYAILEGTPEIAAALLEYGADPRAVIDYRSGAHNAFSLVFRYCPRSTQFAFIKVLLDHGVDPYDRRISIVYLIPKNPLPSEEELELIRGIKLLLDKTKEKDAATKMLQELGSRSCSLDIAKFLVDNGAEVHTIVGNRGTALYNCSKKRTIRAAEFAKYLLATGANPELHSKARKLIAEQPLAKAMPRLLGMTWEELIASVSDTRAL